MYIEQLHHIDALETELSLAELLTDVVKRLDAAFKTIESQIQEISEKTDVDLTTIKVEVAQAKEAANAPVTRYLKEQKEADSKIQQEGERFFDQATRSH